jgi:hypothetical protein
MIQEVVLDEAAIAPFRSPYLNGGYREDEILPTEIRLGDGWAAGHYCVKQCFIPSDGQFHLTVPLAFVAFAQLAIVYAHVDQGYTEKKAEIFLRELHLRCMKPIHETEDVSIELRLTSRRTAPGGAYYRGDIDIQHDSFRGAGSFLLPTQRA